MGYIDCDTHVWETDQTWAYLRPGEEQYRPAVAEVASGNDVPYRFWLVQDQRMIRNDGASPHQTDQHRTLFPEGTKGLDDVEARLREMDRLGVDVQILFPSIWLNVGVRDPIVDAALKRSHNRWLADATKAVDGRLRWMVNVPTIDLHAACEELEFGADNGAAGVFLLGEVNGRHVAHPSLFPLYGACQADDDLSYLVTRLGSDNLVCGSDWGHLDIGADPAAHRMLAARDDVDHTVRHRIVDTNARVLFGIDDAFRPSDTQDAATAP